MFIPYIDIHIPVDIQTHYLVYMCSYTHHIHSMYISAAWHLESLRFPAQIFRSERNPWMVFLSGRPVGWTTRSLKIFLRGKSSTSWFFPTPWIDTIPVSSQFMIVIFIYLYPLDKIILEVFKHAHISEDVWQVFHENPYSINRGE